MKIRSAIKVMCKNCYIVQRGKHRYVYCKLHPKHKQRQGFHTMAGMDMDSCCDCGLPNGTMHAHLPAQVETQKASSVISSLIAAPKFRPEFGIGSIFWKDV